MNLFLWLNYKFISLTMVDKTSIYRELVTRIALCREIRTPLPVSKLASSWLVESDHVTENARLYWLFLLFREKNLRFGFGWRMLDRQANRTGFLRFLLDLCNTANACVGTARATMPIIRSCSAYLHRSISSSGRSCPKSAESSAASIRPPSGGEMRHLTYVSKTVAAAASVFCTTLAKTSSFLLKRNDQDGSTASKASQKSRESPWKKIPSRNLFLMAHLLLRLTFSSWAAPSMSKHVTRVTSSR